MHLVLQLLNAALKAPNPDQALTPHSVCSHKTNLQALASRTVPTCIPSTAAVLSVCELKVLHMSVVPLLQYY